ncbi:MAG: polysaccharide biosynthesis C-terminal domain-containing protein [Eubacterium sp.]|nr:polysaccharide biosynthesis C-terminal domain-containing protein [Eubacterium sp.]
MGRISNTIKHLRNNEKFGDLAKNSVYFLIGSFGSKLLTFFLVPLYTSVLSTYELGLTENVLTTSSILLYVVTLCIGDAVFVFAMKEAEAKGAILKYGIVLVIKGMLVFSVGISVFAWINPVGWPRYNYLVLWIHLCINAFSSLITSYLRAVNKTKEIAVSGLLITLITVGSSILLMLVFPFGIAGYLISLLFGLFVGLIYLVIKCPDLKSAIKGAVCDKEVQHEMLRYSIPLIINGVSWWVNSGLDRYLVTAIAGTDANGIYAIAAKIPTVLSTLNLIFAQAWSISAIKEYDKDDTDGFFGKTYSAYNTMLVLCSSILILLDVPLAGLLYAKSFYVAWESSVWLIISVLFSSMAGFVGSVFGAVRNSKAYALSTIGSAVLNLVLNMILIPVCQEIGAAIATAVSFFALWLIRYLYSKKFIRWKIKIFRDLAGYILLIVQAFACLQETHFYYLQLGCFAGIIVLHWDVILMLVRKMSVGTGMKTGK